MFWATLPCSPLMEPEVSITKRTSTLLASSWEKSSMRIVAVFAPSPSSSTPTSGRTGSLDRTCIVAAWVPNAVARNSTGISTLSSAPRRSASDQSAEKDSARVPRISGSSTNRTPTPTLEMRTSRSSPQSMPISP